MTRDEYQRLRDAINDFGKRDLALMKSTGLYSDSWNSGFATGLSSALIALSEWFMDMCESEANINQGIVRRPEDI